MDWVLWPLAFSTTTWAWSRYFYFLSSLKNVMFCRSVVFIQQKILKYESKSNYVETSSSLAKPPWQFSRQGESVLTVILLNSYHLTIAQEFDTIRMPVSTINAWVVCISQSLAWVSVTISKGSKIWKCNINFTDCEMIYDIPGVFYKMRVPLCGTGADRKKGYVNMY